VHLHAGQRELEYGTAKFVDVGPQSLTMSVVRGKGPFSATDKWRHGGRRSVRISWEKGLSI